MLLGSVEAATDSKETSEVVWRNLNQKIPTSWRSSYTSAYLTRRCTNSDKRSDVSVEVFDTTPTFVIEAANGLQFENVSKADLYIIPGHLDLHDRTVFIGGHLHFNLHNNCIFKIA